jgi:hypothetical protein
MGKPDRRVQRFYNGVLPWNEFDVPIIQHVFLFVNPFFEYFFAF